MFTHFIIGPDLSINQKWSYVLLFPNGHGWETLWQQCMSQEGQWRCFWFDSESFQFPCRSPSSFAAMSAGSITEPPSALEGESIPVHRDFCGCSFPAEIPAMLPAWWYQDASFQPFASSFEDSKATKRLLQQRDVIWIFTHNNNYIYNMCCIMK